MLAFLLAEAPLINVLQGFGPLQGEVGHADAGECVLLGVHPRLQAGVVLPLPLGVLHACLVNLPHCLNERERGLIRRH